MDASFSGIKYEEVFVNDGRQDQKIQVENLGGEAGHRRFSDRGDVLAPQPTTWRNNLTALSQHRNLYFVAFLHQIYVYQPTIRSVGTTPKLILTPSLKRPLAPGYISESRPHAINHLMVGDLGHEEILLLATDSGNISAYRTERIFLAVDQAEDEECVKPEDLGNTVPCFFMDWVERSAWGLAIHKYARLIAVSANTSEITVWAFALIDRAENEHTHLEANPSFMNDWIRMSTAAQFQNIRRLEPQHRRSRNIRITLHGHPNNIPCVGFLNSELDRHGEWLVSTDITNKLFVWRIWESPLPVSGWNLNPIGRTTIRNYIADSYDRGWAVMALDPRSFRVKSSIEEACGGQPLCNQTGSAYDLTPLVDVVPEASTRYMTLPQDRRNEIQAHHLEDGPVVHFPGHNIEGYTVVSEVSNTVLDPLNPFDEPYGDGEDEAEEQEEPPVPSGQPHEQQQLELDPSHGPDDQAEAQPDQDSESESDDMEELLPTDPLFPADEIASSPDEESSEAEEPIDSEEPSEHETDYLVEALLESIYGAADASSQNSEPTYDTPHLPPSSLENPQSDRKIPETYLEFPILHFSEGDLRMFWGQYNEKPSVVCRMVLRQMIPELAPALTNRDRLNIVHQIPELGVVITASQKGRVAILGLTEVPDVGRFLRVERILPFESQEKMGMRPLVPLLGVAVGPVESNLIPVEASAEDDGYDTSSIGGDGFEGDARAETSTKGKMKRRRKSTENEGPKTRPGGIISHTPRESWHGSQYSRRYRLILMYLDHTVLRYELFYDWPKGILGVHHDANQPFSLAL